MHISNLEDTRPPEEVEREQRLLTLLQRVWTYSITTKSDLARDYADEIAEAASRGWLTTLVAFGGPIYGRLWKVSADGLLWLQANGPRIAQEEVDQYEENHCAN